MRLSARTVLPGIVNTTTVRQGSACAPDRSAWTAMWLAWIPVEVGGKYTLKAHFGPSRIQNWWRTLPR